MPTVSNPPGRLPSATRPTTNTTPQVTTPRTEVGHADAAGPNVAVGSNATGGFDAGPGAAQPLPTAAPGPGQGPLGVRLAAELALPGQYSLPAKVPLGAATIHRYDDHRVAPSTIAVTVWAPIAPAGAKASVQNLNAATPGDKLPERFVLTDAGLTRCFIGVDKRPGTALAKRLDALVAQIPKNSSGEIDRDVAIEWVRVNVNKLIKWTSGSSANDGRAEFAWDKAINMPRNVWDTFSSVAYDTAGHPPAPTGQDYPVVPFERYLEAGEGYCLQKAVLAALLLDKVGIASKLVNGAVGQGPGKTTGHTWVELDDGRVLDAAWSKVAAKGPPQAGFTDRYKFGGSFRFSNATFPYLRFDD